MLASLLIFSVTGLMAWPRYGAGPMEMSHNNKVNHQKPKRFYGELVSGMDSSLGPNGYFPFEDLINFFNMMDELELNNLFDDSVSPLYIYNN